MKYRVLLSETGEGVAASVPALPGCHSQGATEAEARANVADAIRDYLAVRDELVRDAAAREVEIEV